MRCLGYRLGGLIALRGEIFGGLTDDDACHQTCDDRERQAEPVGHAQQVEDDEGGYGDEHGTEVGAYTQRAQQVAHGGSLLGFHGIDTCQRKEDAHRGDGHGGYHCLELHLAVHGKGGGSEGSGGKDGTAIAFVEVGTHTCHVAHIVAHVIGYRGRIAGIVFGDVGFYLAHKVGTHIGSLGIDTAAHTCKEGLGRGTHTKGEHGGGDGDQRCGLIAIEGIEDKEPQSNIQQTETYHYQAHHSTTAKGYLQSFVQSPAGCIGCSCRCVGSCLHAKEACQSGEQATGEEGKGHPGVLHLQHVCHEGKENGQHCKNDAHHLVLLFQISHRTFSHVRRNLCHAHCALFLLHHDAEEVPCHCQCRDACHGDKPENQRNVAHCVLNLLG